MSKGVRFLIVTLSLSLAVLTYLGSPNSVANASLDCDELRVCKGAAGCLGGGDPIGCTIYCTGGGTVTCDPRED